MLHVHGSSGQKELPFGQVETIVASALDRTCGNLVLASSSHTMLGFLVVSVVISVSTIIVIMINFFHVFQRRDHVGGAELARDLVPDPCQRSVGVLYCISF